MQKDGISISSLLLAHPEACIWRDTGGKPFNMCTTDPDADAVDGHKKASHSQSVQVSDILLKSYLEERKNETINLSGWGVV